jgi:dipicolinate synthase subunit A
MNNFLFLGGDLRSVHAAKRLGEHYDCFIYGIDKTAECAPVLRELTKFKSLVLPLPASRDGVNINAPYFKEPLPLSLIPEAVYEGGTVFCGRTTPELEEICARHSLRLVDYFEREELAVMNAVPTAEGTLEIIMREQARTIYGSKILLTGFGRISKVLAKYLVVLGAEVTVTARRYSDLAWAEIAGCKPLHMTKLAASLGEYDVIINTVPVEIFDMAAVKRFKPGCLVIDLASESGFGDTEAARAAGVNIIWALSIPGKYAPETAGAIIADTILNILSESKDDN